MLYHGSNKGPSWKFLAVFFLIIFGFAPALHATPIAHVTSFRGEVIVQSEAELTPVTATGHALESGNLILTKEGEAQITFEDGALLDLSPFTTARIQAQEETSGFAFFKRKKDVRRITDHVGKMRFKSGASNAENNLQTPTAVCALRGSEANFGFDNLNTYLDLLSGATDIIGPVLRGFFEAPGISASQKNDIYQALTQTHEIYEKAVQKGDKVEIAGAKVAAAQALVEAAQAMSKNPDTKVSTQASAEIQAAGALKAALTAQAVVETLKEKGASASDIEKAKKDADTATQAAKEAAAAAAKSDVKGAEESAKKAKEAADRVEKVATDLGITTSEVTTEKTTKKSTDDTTALTTTVDGTTTVEETSTAQPSTTINPSTTIQSTTIQSTTIQSTTIQSTTIKPPLSPSQ